MLAKGKDTEKRSKMQKLYFSVFCNCNTCNHVSFVPNTGPTKETKNYTGKSFCFLRYPLTTTATLLSFYITLCCRVFANQEFDLLSPGKRETQLRPYKKKVP